MPSALESLVKVLKLEQNTNYQNKAVIGGLELFAGEWATGAHTQARKPEHHALIDELVASLLSYRALTIPERPERIRYLLGRITGRIPLPADSVQIDSGQIEAAPAPPIEAIREPDPPPIADAPPARGKRPPPQPRRPEPKPTQADAPPKSAKPERRDKPAAREQAPNKPSNPPAARRGNDSHSLFGDRNAPVELNTPEIIEEVAIVAMTPLIREDVAQMPLSLDDLILEPIDLPIAPVARPKAPPPRRRYDGRSLEEKRAAIRKLRESVTTLHGVGPKLAEKLETLEIRTIEELVFCFPRRYDDYTAMKLLNRIRAGELVSAVGTVRTVGVYKGKRNIEVLSVTIDDGSGALTATFFNQGYLKARFNKGDQVVFSGKTEWYQGRITMSNPHWEYVDQDALTTRGIVPIYPLTGSLSAANMRKATQAAIDNYAESLPDIMPDSVLDRVALAEYNWSVGQMHRPSSQDMLEHARDRLMFDDLILLQLGVLRNRREWQSVPARPLPVTDDWIVDFAAALPFPLTGAQKRAIEAIRADVAKPIPMNRLLQGDVGAGKTVVAVAALALAVTNGAQGALMAPTGILAEQHFRGLVRLFARLPDGDRIQIRLLTGATPASERADTLAGLADGSVQIIIGTHALIQSDVNIAHLGVVVVDEQHRFGVEQRGKLRGKGLNPHALVMTATPIPRTIALTAYADLDLTVLDEMPPGRTPITTFVFMPTERERVYRFMQAEADKGRQAFIVYPLVEASENEAMAAVPSAIEEFARLKREIFPDLRLALLHGRMNQAEKDAVMSAFSRGEADILIATAVIEVGIDIPNATMMLIEGANRFGLAQLHQFRGRVGRGQHQSYCVLIPENANEPDNPRLRALEETTDGYELAKRDLEMRGAGELLGTRQSGGDSIGKLSAFMTPRIIEMAQIEARAIYAEDPALSLPEHALLQQKLQLVYGTPTETELS